MAKLIFCVFGRVDLSYDLSRSQINNRKIGNVNCLHNRIEPFPGLFWALGIVLPHILQQQPAGLASLNRGTSTVLYTQCKAGVSWVQFYGRSVAPNPFPLLLILWLEYTKLKIKILVKQQRQRNLQYMYIVQCILLRIVCPMSMYIVHMQTF